MLLPYWPPMGGPGVQRGVKFAKYLPDYGVTPYVVTRTIDNEEDRSLLADAAGVAVKYARHIPFQRLGKPRAGQEAAAGGARRVAALKRVRDWLQLPDHVVTWVPFAVREAAAWAAEAHPGAIFTTSPYHSTHLAGLALKKRLGIPWIAEFRDPWTSDRFTTYPTPLHRRLNAKLERRVLENADAVVVISEGMRRDFASRYPEAAARIEVIYNGFDPADFEAVEKLEPPPGPPWIVRHLGTFYPDRKPDSFLRGLAAFFALRPEARGKLKVELYGKHHADVEARLRTLAHALGIDGEVSFFPYVSHAEAVRLQRQSHALLLVPGPGETTVTGKLFEYLAAGRPIIVTAPYPSGVDEVLGKLGRGYLRSDDTPEATVPALSALYETLTAGNWAALVPPADRVAQFTRAKGAARIAELIAELRQRMPER